MGYILLSPEYIENVESHFQGWHLFNSSANYTNDVNDNNNKILHIVYKINNAIPLCDNKKFKSIENVFKDFESLRKEFSDNLEYSNEIFNFKANSTIDWYYFTDSKNTFYYSARMSVIRAIASILGEIVCENCLATLYGNNIENYMVLGIR